MFGHYVDKVLQEGEQVRYIASLHWILYAPGTALLFLAALLYMSPLAGGLGTLAWLGALVALAAAVILLAREWFIWWTTEIAVTNRRVIYKTGFISRKTTEMHMDKVESVDVEQSMWSRLHADLPPNAICATIAAWDQAPLRQAHVERYPRATQLIRIPYNLTASLCRLPRLPAIGARLPYVYLSFIAVENDDVALCAALLRHVYNALCHGPWLYALAAMPDDDPLLPALAEYAGTTSIVKAFEVNFSPAIDPTPSIEPQRVGVEFALS